ncbi:MAG TPA: CHAT domain-containing protein [Pyrinomonadaceae bacterium]|nr:CHAT domain-containing protein [Pyrinomonadaceae bacterium]
MKKTRATATGLGALLVLAFFCCVPTLAQTRDETLASAEKAFNEAIRLSETNKEELIPLALQNYRTAQGLYHQLGDKRGEGNALRGVGRSYLRLNNRDDALKAYGEALGLFEEIPRKIAIAMTASEIGDIYAQSSRREDLGLAVDYYKKASSNFTEPDNKKTKALVLANMARMYVLLRNKQEGLNASTQALLLFQELNDNQGQAFALSYIAGAYEISLDTEDKLQALNHYRKANEIYSTLGNRNERDVKNERANTLLNTGNVLIALSNNEGAIKSYLLALGLYRELEYKTEVALTLDNLGLAYAFVSDTKGIQQSVDSYLESARIYLETKDGKPAGAAVLAKIGDLYFRFRNKEQALNFYKQTQAIYQELSLQNLFFKPGVARGFNAIGGVYEYLGDEKEKPLAIENYRKAEAIYRELFETFRKQDDKPDQAQALRDLGDMLFRSKDWPAAIDAYKRAAETSKAIPSEGMEASLLAAISQTYSQSEKPEDFRQSVVYGRMAQQLFNKNGDKNGEIWSLRRIASSYEQLDDWEAYGKANSDLMEIAKSLKYPYGERLKAEVYMTLGDAYELRGDSKASIGNYESALSISRGLKHKDIESDALLSLVQLYFVTGESGKLLSRSDELLSILTPEDQNYTRTKGLVHYFRGAAYSMLGDKARGTKELQTGLMFLHEINREDVEEFLKPLTGNSYLVTGEKDKERNSFEEVERGLDKIKDDSARAYALYYLAASLVHSDNGSKALDYAQQSLALSRKTNNRLFESMSLVMIGFMKWDKDENLEAASLHQQALIIFRELNSQWFEVIALTGLMEEWRDERNPQLAIFYGKQAVKLFHGLRKEAKSLDIELQQGYARQLDELYTGLTALLISQGRLDEAQQVINLSRDQEFFDLGNNQNQTPTEIQFTPREEANSLTWEAELNKTSKSLEQIDLVTAQSETLNAETARKLQPLQASYKKTYDEYLLTLKKIEENLKQLPDAKDKRLIVSDVTDMQDALCVLSGEQKTAALYTFISEDKLYILLNTCHEPVQVFQTPVAAEELNKKLKWFYALLQSKVFDPRKLGKELYDDIIPKPLEAKLQSDKIETLTWSLDGNLRYVPMAALSPDGTHYLIERYNNAVFTRANKERMTRKVSPNWTGYGFFVSEPHVAKIDGKSEPIPFPGIDKGEAQIFSTPSYHQGIITGDVFSEAMFTKDALLSISRQKRPLVHISSHFRFVPGDPDLSFLLLGNNDIMPLSELKGESGIFQDVELLTLSACDTAAQLANADGKEIDGFAELAQRLGAGSVLASLWSVSDVSTTLLMKDFYRNRQAGKLNKTKALRESQLDLLYGRNEASSDSRNLRADDSVGQDSNKTKGNQALTMTGIDEQYLITFHDEKSRFAHPYYWSPFVLFGNAR